MLPKMNQCPLGFLQANNDQVEERHLQASEKVHQGSYASRIRSEVPMGTGYQTARVHFVHA